MAYAIARKLAAKRIGTVSALCDLMAFASGPVTARKDDVSAAVTARKDDAPAASQAATVNVAGFGWISGGGGLIQTISGWRQRLVDRDQRRGFL